VNQLRAATGEKKTILKKRLTNRAAAKTTRNQNDHGGRRNDEESAGQCLREKLGGVGVTEPRSRKSAGSAKKGKKRKGGKVSNQENRRYETGVFSSTRRVLVKKKGCPLPTLTKEV